MQSGINSHKREVQFNLKNSPLSYNLKMKRKYQLQKQRNNSQIFFPKEDNKIKGRSHSNFIIKKKIIENSEDFCDIIEGEDEFECEKNTVIHIVMSVTSHFLPDNFTKLKSIWSCPPINMINF